MTFESDRLLMQLEDDVQHQTTNLNDYDCGSGVRTVPQHSQRQWLREGHGHREAAPNLFLFRHYYLFHSKGAFTESREYCGQWKKN